MRDEVDRTCAVPLSRSKAKPPVSARSMSASTVSRLASPRLANGCARSSRCVNTLPRNVRVGPLLFTSRLARTLPAEASASVVSTRSRSIGPEALTAPDTTSGRRCRPGMRPENSSKSNGESEKFEAIEPSSPGCAAGRYEKEPSSAL